MSVTEFLSNTMESPYEGPLPTRCLLWTGPVIENTGYGTFKGERAHRYSFMAFRGEIPEDRNYISHECDTPLCVRPEHLEAKTPKENSEDCLKRGRLGKRLNPGKHLVEDQVKEIHAMEDAGVHRHEIAAKFGRTWRQIEHILHGTRWKKLHPRYDAETDALRPRN